MDSETLYVRNLTKEQKTWVKIKCLELNCNLGEYLGRLINREMKAAKRARLARKPRTVKRDNSI